MTHPFLWPLSCMPSTADIWLLVLKIWSETPRSISNNLCITGFSNNYIPTTFGWLISVEPWLLSVFIIKTKQKNMMFSIIGYLSSPITAPIDNQSNCPQTACGPWLFSGQHLPISHQWRRSNRNREKDRNRQDISGKTVEFKLFYFSLIMFI